MAYNTVSCAFGRSCKLNIDHNEDIPIPFRLHQHSQVVAFYLPFCAQFFLVRMLITCSCSIPRRSVMLGRKTINELLASESSSSSSSDEDVSGPDSPPTAGIIVVRIHNNFYLQIFICIGIAALSKKKSQAQDCSHKSSSGCTPGRTPGRTPARIVSRFQSERPTRSTPGRKTSNTNTPRSTPGQISSSASTPGSTPRNLDHTGTELEDDLSDAPDADSDTKSLLMAMIKRMDRHDKKLSSLEHKIDEQPSSSSTSTPSGSRGHGARRKNVPLNVRVCINYIFNTI